ncbi:putative nucleotide-binding alpha-beta plait domain-containing protein [Medicago truncatula]|uniref:Putative nucleotide-binding alpha-beta plait domain-containing protein n=1 Tax=Medicago truncatula TaxID=3880 RepID=A0A396JQX5_MEDTR|nr:putative nucleotide-binding alpha-beta plait domain-containing protein [Medicago truncatula]
MATAAGMASLFSSSINTVKCLRSKNSSLDTSSNRMFVSLISQSSVEPLSIGTTVSHKLWFPRISVAVAQEEAVVAVEDEEKVVEYGSAELIEVLYDRDTGKSRGFAFVTMSCVEDCNAVIQNLDGKEFMGRTLRVNFSDKPKPKEPLYPETEYKLFVGNLAWTVTSESLTQAFQEHGTVVGARVLFDGETGKSRGYGFVSYATKSEMDTALAIMDNVELEGRTLRVSLAQGKRS